jgi:general secretion pathway protein H
MNVSGRAYCRSGELGFSLLEMLAVLAIVALSLALVAPSFNRARIALAARSAAYALAADLRATRTLASSQSMQRHLVVDHARRTYRSEGIGPARVFSPTLRISILVPESEQIGPTSRIRFLPDGSASGGKIVLQGGNAAWSVVVDWLSGDVRVFSGS